MPTTTTPELDTVAAKLKANSVLAVQRPADQLRLRIQLVNLKQAGQNLVAVTAGQPSYLRVYLPAQHVGEEAVAPGGTVGASRFMKHRVAGESRIVLRVAPPIPLTMTRLLDWDDLALVLDQRGHLEDGPPFPTGAPTSNTTVLELPEGLQLSPDDQSRFVGRVSPATRGAVTEEWTARLQRVSGGVLSEPSAAAPIGVRAIWTSGYVAGNAAIASKPDPFTRPIKTDQRKELVRAMGDPASTTAYPNHEQARAQRLWVGATGGWLDAEGSWSGGSGAVSAWRHRAVTGRDSSVTIVERGYLAPFGVPASVATISERVFAAAANGLVAHLQQKEILIVGEVAVASPRQHAPVGDRRSLFTSITGSGSYGMTRGQIDSGGLIDTDDAFVPLNTGGNPTKVAFRAVDRAGRRISFTSMVAFVSIDVAFDPAAGAVPAKVVDHLRAAGTKADRVVDMKGQQLAFADEVTPGDGKTTLRALDVTFDARTPANGATQNELRDAGQPAFFASMETATVHDDAGESMGGVPGSSFAVELAPGWVNDANSADNFGKVFLTIPTPSGLDFGGDLAGLVAPSLTTGQIGQVIGRSVSLPSAGSSWTPASALQAGAKLFGSIALEWLLDSFNVPDLGDVRLPRFDLDIDFSLPEIPSEICQKFDWEPEVKSVVVGDTPILCIQQDLAQPGIGEDLEDPFGSPTKLAFHIQQCVSLDPATPGEPHTTVEFSLSNFVLQFPPAVPMLAVYVDRLRYLDLPDSPADVDVEINGIQLVGPLNFLDALVELLPDSIAGFDVKALDGLIDVDLDIKLPSINVGVFGLTDLSLGMGVSIPLGDSAMTTRLSLGSRENPFSLTIMGIGGTGSIEIEAAPHPAGLVRVEIVIGVLIELAIDVIVAKGSISASFSMGIEVEKVTAPNASNGGALELIDKTTLTAALECVGEIEVLGLITITIEFLLALEYDVTSRILEGEVSVTVEVDAGIIKKSVTFSVQQKFALGGDPNHKAIAARAINDKLDFSSRFAASGDWDAYCGAFA
jgi:hypothetical protein